MVVRIPGRDRDLEMVSNHHQMATHLLAKILSPPGHHMSKVKVLVTHNVVAGYSPWVLDLKDIVCNV
jgi:hypothetical protein